MSDLKTRSVEEVPSIRRELVWAAVWFVALLAVRVAVVPLSLWFGLDESNQYLLVRPVAFLSDWALLAAGFVAFIRFVFPNTLGRDIGTRFNRAWAELDNPFHILILYVAIGAPLFLALAILLGMN